jgi:hypothetical protein
VAYAFGFFKADEEILIPRLREILQLQMTISKESRFAKTLGRNALREEDTALLTVSKALTWHTDTFSANQIGSVCNSSIVFGFNTKKCL